jgi:hypothetical protein
LSNLPFRSSGALDFYKSCHETSVKMFAYTTCSTTFDRYLNGKELRGTVLCYGHVVHPYIKDYTLGPLKRGCFNLNPTILTRGHIQFKDMHGGTRDLWPAIPYPPDVTIPQDYDPWM